MQLYFDEIWAERPCGLKLFGLRPFSLRLRQQSEAFSKPEDVLKCTRYKRFHSYIMLREGRSASCVLLTPFYLSYAVVHMYILIYTCKCMHTVHALTKCIHVYYSQMFAPMLYTGSRE